MFSLAQSTLQAHIWQANFVVAPNVLRELNHELRLVLKLVTLLPLLLLFAFCQHLRLRMPFAFCLNCLILMHLHAHPLPAV
jgi:hypothetical protein